MPFVSEAQRRWMYANHPAMAARWEKHTPAGTKLPPRKDSARLKAKRKAGLVTNAFCATGQGGGVDPTCSPTPNHGMPNGVHTPEGAEKIRQFLEKETGEKLKVHGSVAEGKTSKNDIDISVLPKSEEEQEAAYHRQMVEEGKIQEAYRRGEITHDEMMKRIYGEDVDAKYTDPFEKALGKMGFQPTKLMEWSGIAVTRYENKATNHRIEIWQQGSTGGNEMRSTDLTKNGWVTLQSGQHVFISDDGHVQPHGEGKGPNHLSFPDLPSRAGKAEKAEARAELHHAAKKARLVHETLHPGTFSSHAHDAEVQAHEHRIASAVTHADLHAAVRDAKDSLRRSITAPPPKAPASAPAPATNATSAPLLQEGPAGWEELREFSRLMRSAR